MLDFCDVYLKIYHQALSFFTLATYRLFFLDNVLQLASFLDSVLQNVQSVREHWKTFTKFGKIEKQNTFVSVRLSIEKENENKKKTPLGKLDSETTKMDKMWERDSEKSLQIMSNLCLILLILCFA